MSLRARKAGLRSHRRNTNAVVELTPLIDIVFQLLIFFLLTATFQNNPSLKVDLPKAKSTDVSQDPKGVVVVVSPEGTFEVDNKRVDERELELRLCTAAQEDPATKLRVKADRTTQHQYVVQVMDLARRCGLKGMDIVTGR